MTCEDCNHKTLYEQEKKKHEDLKYVVQTLIDRFRLLGTDVEWLVKNYNELQKDGN